MAMPYTLLDQASLHTDMAACAAHGVSVVVGSPFASGILATGARDGARYGYRQPAPDIVEKVNALEKTCRAFDTPLPTAALHFVLAHPSVVAVIPGATRPEEVGQNVASLRRPVPAELWTALKTEGLIASDAPVPVETVDVASLVGA